MYMQQIEFSPGYQAKVWKYVWRLGFGIWLIVGLSAPSRCHAAQDLTLQWTNNLLTISGPNLPGGKLEVLYLEAFCRKGSTHRSWGETTLPHHTALIAAEPHHLRFRTRVEPDVEVLHDLRASPEEIDFQFTFHNKGRSEVDLEWFQPACIRVPQFTGCDQNSYTSKSFIFTERGLTRLNQTRRTVEALYRGGQVYVPKSINLADVNPRPLCTDAPTNGLIGCFSGDGKYLLATASDRTQELFEGVFVCLHSDPRVGGLAPGETKHIRAKLYILPNDPDELMRRYRRDLRRERTVAFDESGYRK